MKTYDELKALIEQRGVHPEFGDAGEGWGIEQNPHELATFLVRMQELGVQSCLEIGTGYKGGLSRFLAADMGWDVTTVDIKNYGHVFEGVHYVIGSPEKFGRIFDLVFIDGNHEYESVKRDYEKMGKAHAYKAIAFHDIAGLRDCDGVYQFWRELSLEPSSLELTLKVQGVARSLSFYKTGFNEVIDRNYLLIGPDKSAGIGWIEL